MVLTDKDRNVVIDDIKYYLNYSLSNFSSLSSIDLHCDEENQQIMVNLYGIDDNGNSNCLNFDYWGLDNNDIYIKIHDFLAKSCISHLLSLNYDDINDLYDELQINTLYVQNCDGEIQLGIQVFDELEHFLNSYAQHICQNEFPELNNFIEQFCENGSELSIKTDYVFDTDDAIRIWQINFNLVETKDYKDVAVLIGEFQGGNSIYGIEHLIKKTLMNFDEQRKQNNIFSLNNEFKFELNHR